MKRPFIVFALISIGVLLWPVVSKAAGITPTPSVAHDEFDIVTDPGSAPCTRRVRLTYQRNGVATGINQWYFLIEPCPTDHTEYPSVAAPKAILILFTGGSGFAGVGAGEPGGTNFVVRQRYAFAAAVPAIVAVIDAASDFQSNNPGKPCSTGSGLRGCRYSEDHMIDVANVIQDLRETLRFPSNLPVWLVGTSRGTISAVAAATQLEQAFGPNGLVLTSTVISDPDPNEDVLDANLDLVTVPVQIIAHRHDECRVSDPDGDPVRNPLGLRALIEGLTASTKVKTKLFSGGYPAIGENCGPLSPHGFFGVEHKVTKSIAKFIRKR